MVVNCKGDRPNYPLVHNPLRNDVAFKGAHRVKSHQTKMTWKPPIRGKINDFVVLFLTLVASLVSSGKAPALQFILKGLELIMLLMSVGSI